MKRGFCFLWIGLAALLVAACGGENYGPPVKARTPEYFKTIVGKWRYDMEFMMKEEERYRDTIIARTEREAPGISTPQSEAVLDSVIKANLAKSGWADYRLEFLPDSKFIIRQGKNIVRGTYGHGTKNTKLYFSKMMKIQGKTEEFIFHRLDSTTLYQDVLLSVERMDFKYSDIPFYKTHKFIRDNQ